MKIQLIALVGSVTPLLTPMIAQASAITPNYSDLYVLGDSLVDDGNLFNLNGQTFPPNPIYFEGRFSNGPTFAELLPEKLGLVNDPNKNVAIGGSGTGNFHVDPRLNPGLNGGTIAVGLRTQVSQIIGGSGGTLDPNALYLISTGLNDYVYIDPSKSPTAPDFLPASAANVDTVIGNIGEALNRLQGAGARKFLVTGIANYSSLPIAFSGDLNGPVYNHLNAPDALSADDLTDLHNSKLKTLLTDFSAPQNVNAIYFDLDGFFSDALANAGSLGFTNTTEGCFNTDIADFNPFASLCSNPDEYIFFDRIHPTARSHELLAEGVAEAVPEPLTILGAGAAIGFGSLFKRKLAKADAKS
ncbi:MAG: PEP-CTERM sorting domain-containing protein [Crocosphaera sp.]